MYLLTKKQIYKLAEGKLKPPDIIKPENIAIFTYISKDIKNLLEPDDLRINFKGLINCLRNGLEEYIINCIENFAEQYKRY